MAGTGCNCEKRLPTKKENLKFKIVHHIFTSKFFNEALKIPVDEFVEQNCPLL